MRSPAAKPQPVGRGFGNACAWAHLEWHLRWSQVPEAGKQDAVCWVWWKRRGTCVGGGGGSGHNGPLYVLESLSLLDSGLLLPFCHPPTGLDKYQDIWKMNSFICFGPPLLLPKLQ